MARPTGRPVRDELLAAARPLIQRAGIGGFSYADLATEVGIRAPSIHHHFPSKADLVAEVTAQYRSEFAARVDAITSGTCQARLQQYAHLFNETSAAGLICLCGAIAADWTDAGDAPRDQVAAFFADQELWVADQLRAGVAAGECRADLNADHVALTFVAALEGTMLMSRASARGDLALVVSSTLLSLV